MRLQAFPTKEELGALAEELTVAQTYFFRHVEQLYALRTHVLRERVRAQGGCRRLRVLCAGCANGEEAYSIAIVLNDLPRDPAWNISIHGVDLSAAAIARAKRGRYTAWSLRETRDSVRERWFRGEGGEFHVADAIRAAVTFDVCNLADPHAPLWRAGAYDVVFCRNVIMSFTPVAARALVARIAHSLSPGGYLFLGNAESLRDVSSPYRPLQAHGALYYQCELREAGIVQHQPPTGACPMSPGVADASISRPDSIAQFADRIALMPIDSDVPDNLRSALELLRHERFTDALKLVRLLPSAATFEPETQLIRAALLVHQGKFAQAQLACHELLAAKPDSATARYLLALCLEGEDDLRAATEHDRLAIHFDAMFAMPHLHLALLARRAGDKAMWRRELSEAAMLLPIEEEKRVILFGGGFSREALHSLCQTHLQADARRP
jgi:chemotaxis protein methyltransferase CheR